MDTTYAYSRHYSRSRLAWRYHWAGCLTSVTAACDLISLFFPGIGLAFGINFGFMFALVLMQNPAYKKWKNEGRAAMLAHSYNIQRSVIFFVGFVVMSIVVFTLLYFLTSATS